MRYAIKLLLFLLVLVSTAGAQPDGITGQWTEPTGSVIRVDHCGPDICMWVVKVSQKAPSKFDIYNPDPAERKRSLCGLQIGNGFVPRSPVEAGDGKLYDPKSGKTYHGQIKLNGNKLELRGYVGLPLFGETQIWTRPVAPVSACTSSGESE
jgi:uncharacterized protein (DUF2147 family)